MKKIKEFLTMKPYENMSYSSKYGHYDETTPAGYIVEDGKNIPSPWYYIYQNRKILLYVDQNGPVKVQYQPPSGILICKRELGETQSKMQTWVQSSVLNNGVPVSNFNSPKLTLGGEEPKQTISWNAVRAVYKSEYENVDIITELFVPYDKATVCVKTTIVNKTDKEIDVKVTPSIFPYINIPQMVAWDLPEWYVSAKTYKRGNMFTYAAKMRSPEMIKSAERSVTYNLNFDESAEFDLDLAKYQGTGNFFAPKSVIEDAPLTYSFKDADKTPGFGSSPLIMAAKYTCNIPAGKSKTFTQALTVQEDVDFNESENDFEQVYFNDDTYENRVKETEVFFNDLFTNRTIKTDNELYNKFLNEFAPLQMYWVCSLDRGWPSSMRGTRDASQDFIGLLPLYPEWTKENIKEIFSRQRTDGWYPRQFNAITRKGPHDLRYYCDGGAFLLELMFEYFTFTRDFNFLNEKVVWLDSDEESTVLAHLIKTFDFYLDPVNIGEHGLCKAWYGDWWDPMDKIGMDGIGETVTVSAQMVLNYKNFANLFEKLIKEGALDKRYESEVLRYRSARENMLEAMRTHAYNKLGYFNGYYNDNKKWLLSDNDPDGDSRLYLVSNAWAIISGCADKEMRESTIANIEKRSYTKFGYYTNDKGFPVAIDKAGRKGNGSQPKGATYNHAQSFFARACCVAGKPNLAYKATRHILPIDEELVPTEKTYAPPYAIANAYSVSDTFPYRVGFQFLSGTVSYVLRTVYNFFFGITYELDGLAIKPAMPEAFGNSTATFSYLGKKFVLNYIKTNKTEKIVTVNGKVWADTKYYDEDDRFVPFISDDKMEEENVINVEY